MNIKLFKFYLIITFFFIFYKSAKSISLRKNSLSKSVNFFFYNFRILFYLLFLQLIFPPDIFKLRIALSCDMAIHFRLIKIPEHFQKGRAATNRWAQLLGAVNAHFGFYAITPEEGENRSVIGHAKALAVT